MAKEIIKNACIKQALQYALDSDFEVTHENFGQFQGQILTWWPGRRDFAWRAGDIWRAIEGRFDLLPQTGWIVTD